MNLTEVIQQGELNLSSYSIEFNEKSNRRIDPKTEEAAKQEWLLILQKAHEDGLKPWDGVYYRLENLNELRNNSKRIKLSTVRYSQIRAFQKLKVSERFPTEFHTLHISTLGIVITKNDKYIFGYREKSLNASQYTYVGGGLQQDELDVKTSQDIEKNIFKELKEEINVNREQVVDIKFTKIYRAIERMNVYFVFKLKLGIDSSEVQKLYSQLKEKEHDRLEFIDKNNLKNFANKNLPEALRSALI